MPFKFDTRTKRPDFPPIMRPKIEVQDDILTGIVKGKKASDLEEYFALALAHLGLGFYFQYIINTEFTIPGQPKNVDFIVYVGRRVYPVEIYGSYFHNSYGDRIRDLQRERLLNDEFDKRGWEQLSIVWEWEVYSFESAVSTVRRLFLI